MAKFADYGFNKSHAAAYALVAYQTAWMKANHAEVFIAACMSLALGNTDRLAALREEALRSGICILPPDINRSGADFTVERTDDDKLAIRYALAAVKKVGFAAMQSLTETRGAQTFADLADFAERIDPRQLNRMQIENLIRAGAFDILERNRARLFAVQSPCCAVLRPSPKKRKPARSRCSADPPALHTKRCGCPRCRIGRPWSGSTSRPRQLVSISHHIRWTVTPRHCVGWASRPARRLKRVPIRTSHASVWPAWSRAERAGDAHRQSYGLGENQRYVRFMRGDAVR